MNSPAPITETITRPFTRLENWSSDAFEQLEGGSLLTSTNTVVKCSFGSSIDNEYMQTTIQLCIIWLYIVVK